MTTRQRAGFAAVFTVMLLVATGCTASRNPSAGGTSPTTTTQPPCAGAQGVGTEVPDGLGPGDLVDSLELTSTSKDLPGFPEDARVWRVLYVSTGVDETQLELICGMVAAPSAGPVSEAGSGRMLAWAHGTIGLEQRCLPSTNPATHLWGPTPAGLGAISWGSAFGAHKGEPDGGILQYAMDHGWVLTASDYQPDDTYVVGKIAGANVLDSARAAAQLVAAASFAATGEDGQSDVPDRYDLISWGHSQGGHAAAWAGQLAETYLDQTEPSVDTAPIDLVGVALEAPATNFIAQPELQPGLVLGDGLADQEMHESLSPLAIPLAPFQVQIGPALFSYIFGSWNELSKTPLAEDAEFPAYPDSAPDLRLRDVTTAEGATTTDDVRQLCLAGSDVSKVQGEVAPYRNAAEHAMLIPKIWNLPAKDYSAGEYFRGGLDRACAEKGSEGLEAWCDWTRFNLPGPAGDNPFPKVAEQDDVLVPTLIVQGTDDQIIHCVTPAGADDNEAPGGADCMSRAYYDSLAEAAYCPSGEPSQGFLQLDLFRVQRFVSPATHNSITGQIASAGDSKDSADLVFEGSRLQEFMTGAFDATLTNGCAIDVVNAT